MFNEQCESGSNLCIKQTSSVNIYLDKSMSEPFSKATTISDEHEYSNICTHH